MNYTKTNRIVCIKEFGSKYSFSMQLTPMSTFNHLAIKLLLIHLLCLNYFLAAAQTSFTQSPTVAANSSLVGSNAWSSPNNIFTNNNISSSVSTRGISNFVSSSSYAYDLAGPGNITGIAVEVLRGSSGVQNVALLDNWSSGLSKSISAGINRCLVVMVALETGTDLREVTSMTYGGQAMTEVANVAAVSGFYARMQTWILNEAGIAAASSTTILPVFTGTIHAEYCENFSSATFIHVDQYTAVSSTVQSSLTSPPSNSYQIGSPLSTLTGSMSIAAVITGNRPTPAPASGGAGGFTVNSSFTAGSNIYFAHASYTSSGASFMTTHKSSSGIGTEQPTFTFDGTANRFAAVAISLRRARNMDNVVRLTKAGTVVGSNLANLNVEWPTTNAYITYGGNGNLWGTTWTISDINNTGFGSVFSAIVQNGIANVDHVRIIVWMASTLSITLQNFDAEIVDKNVIIEWRTSSEINNEYFTVLRSSDSKTWEEIRRVSAAGNTTQVRDYSITDTSPLNGISYYRLMQTDYDGSYTYSNIRLVNFVDLDKSIILYPRPAENYVSVKSYAEIIKVSILDASGQIMKVFNNCKGRLDISSLNSGLYYVEVINTEDSFYRKLYVSK